MRQTWIVYRKEMQEMWHNRKWLWIPLVFTLLGVMQPVLTHLMPQILKMSSGLPKGTIIHIPAFSAASVVAKAQSQFGTLGMLILVLAFMGTTSAERQRGILELVLVKPVSHIQYILAKWLAIVTLAAVALSFGYLGAWYYTEQLIGHTSLLHVLLGAWVYTFWIVVVLTITILFSTLFVSPIATAFLTLLFAVGVSSISGLLNWHWSPGDLPNQAARLITDGTSSSLLGGLSLGCVIILVVLLGTANAFRTRIVSVTR